METMDAPTSFRTNIRMLRTALRISQEELALDAETSTSFVSDIETGKALPTLDTMDRLAGALGVAPSDLLTAHLFVSAESDEEIEVGALPARPAIALARRPKKARGRPRTRT